jgi:hypothetical protein
MAFTSGYARAFTLAALLCLAAFVASFIIPYIRIGPRQASETEGREGLDVLVDIEGEALLTRDPTVPTGTPLLGDGSP